METLINILEVVTAVVVAGIVLFCMGKLIRSVTGLLVRLVINPPHHKPPSTGGFAG